MRARFLAGVCLLLALAVEVSAQGPAPIPEPPVEMTAALEAQRSEAPGEVGNFDDLYFPRFWGRAEFLYWWSKSSPVPVPLVTLADLGNANPGAIGQPGTQVLLGNQNLPIGGRPGGRFTLGFSFDREQEWGFEGNYLFLQTDSASESVFSSGLPGTAPLGIPFLNANTGLEDVTRLAAPGAFSGAAGLRITDFFQGAEANVLHGLDHVGGIRLDGLVGFRWLNLQERLTFATSSPNVPPNPPDIFQTFDQFNATSNFYGGQFGLRASTGHDWLFLNATGKLAFGATRQSVSVNGATFTNDYSGNGTVITYPGGYFAQTTNMGRTSHTAFAVVPEIDLNLGVRLTPWANVFVGYSFLYISSVARPGEQIDRVINPTQAVAISGPNTFSGPARPAPMNNSTDFWVQGINVGLELRY